MAVKIIMGHYTKYLYSINTQLAYSINENYYNGSHYVWCTARYDEKQNPPSSNPREIVHSFSIDVDNRDSHSSKIEQNRMGLLKGVNAKFSAGIINEKTRDEIRYIITNADITYFKPIIYIINRNSVNKSLVRVPANETAEFFSQEFLIEDLKSKHFDIIIIK